jgi:hypothetical protein
VAELVYRLRAEYIEACERDSMVEAARMANAAIESANAVE